MAEAGVTARRASSCRKVCIHAGAGIVADSVPINEYEETRSKARGMMKALALAKHYQAARMAGEES